MNWAKLKQKRAALAWSAVAVAVLLVLVGINVRQTLGRTSQVPIYSPVERGDVVDTVEATGTVDAFTTVNVGAQISGMIDKILVDFNSNVKKGQLLAHIEDTPFAAAAKQARANVQAAVAAVKMAQVAVETAGEDLKVARANLARDEALARQAKTDFERAEGLFRSEVVATQDRDTAKSNNDTAQAAALASRAMVEQADAQLKNAQAGLLQARAAEATARASLAQAETNLSYTRIISPTNGVVVARNVDVGQTVASRLSAPDMFDIAEDLGHMYVYTKLDVHDVPRVKVGQKGTFAVDAFPNQAWEGVVKQIRISPITQLKGQSSPSQLPAQLTAAQTAIPGLQQQSSGSAQTPAGASGGASASSGASSSSGAGSGGAAPSVSPSTVPAATQAPGLVQYDALVEFQNADHRLLPGMTAYVTIPVSAAYNVVRIRKEALGASPSISLAEKNELLKRYSIARNQDVVWMAEGDRFRPVAVKTGVTDYVFAEVSGALEPGQRLLSGYRPQ